MEEQPRKILKRDLVIYSRVGQEDGVAVEVGRMLKDFQYEGDPRYLKIADEIINKNNLDLTKKKDLELFLGLYCGGYVWVAED